MARGKSTLARIIAGITKPTSGVVFVNDIDTENKAEFKTLRRTIGIVFQNPDTQIIFNNVHDDIIFALDNLELDNKEERIEKALKEVGMEKYINCEAFDLSLGQKQRITIAGVLSIGTKIIVLDEPTAMLDPQGKEDIRKIVKQLKEKGFTIVYVTNIIEEVLIADRVIVLEKGKVTKEFFTKEILENIEFLKENGIAVPRYFKSMIEVNE